MRGDGRMAKNPKKTLLRLLGYMRKYLPILVVVLVCIFLTSFAQTMASRSLGTLVDDYILPMVSSGSTDYSPMARFLLKIAGVFAIVVVVAVSFPVNAWALAAKQVPNLMSLPVQDALVLIAISVLLTVVAGLLPARSASKKDPVEALRSE